MWKAWLAGVIDGEGCINIYKSKKHHSIRISIANTDMRLLEKACSIIGYGTISSNGTHPPAKPAYTLFIEKSSAIKRVLEDVRPWLVVKGEHADIVLQFCKTISHKKTPSDIYELRERLMGQIKVLTRKGLPAS